MPGSVLGNLIVCTYACLWCMRIWDIHIYVSEYLILRTTQSSFHNCGHHITDEETETEERSNCPRMSHRREWLQQLCPQPHCHCASHSIRTVRRLFTRCHLNSLGDLQVQPKWQDVPSASGYIGWEVGAEGMRELGSHYFAMKYHYNSLWFLSSTWFKLTSILGSSGAYSGTMPGFTNDSCLRVKINLTWCDRK